MEKKICNVCADNKSILEFTKCIKCDYECCKSCLKTYIKTNFKDIVNCMNCKITFTRHTLTNMLGITYITKDFQKIQNKIRVDRQISKLSNFQETAKTELLIEKENKELEELIKIIKEKKIYINDLHTTLRFPNTTIKKNYIRPCSVADCRGFLNSNYNCELCNTSTCSDCLEIKKSDHICDENTKATASLIKKDTKNCPKCGMGIFKIDGCFGENTKIPLWNGKIKKIQDIVIGDILIGDDGNPREVLNTFNGEDNLYEVEQENGINYIVNSKHELVLKNELEEYYKIKAEDYINLEEIVKNKLYGFKSKNTINWEYTKISLDPYLLGLCIGDYFKNIPINYIINNEEVRLNLLAGIIDNCGFIKSYDKKILIIQNNLNIVKKIEYLVKSLGFCVNILFKEKIYKIYILGENINKIPTKLYKNKILFDYKKDIYKTKIDVKSIGKGKYYGFELDKNHLFVLTDMTVQKNCDQMFCNLCQTAFSWKTGIIEVGRIHNPHYYEFLRKQNNGEIPREEDIVERLNCRNRLINNNILRHCNSIYKNNTNDKIKNIVLFITDYIRYYFHNIAIKESFDRNLINIDEKINRLNIDYLKGKIIKDNYEKSIGVYEKKKELFTEKNMIMITLTDNINDIILEFYDKIIEIINKKIIITNYELISTTNLRLYNLIEYCKEEDIKLSKLYSSKSRLYIDNFPKISDYVKSE